MRVLLLALGNVPFDEIVIDARGRGFDAMEAPGNGRQGVGDEEKGVRLVFGQDFLKFEIGLPPLFPVKGVAPLGQKPVHLEIFVAGEVELAGLGLGGTPDVDIGPGPGRCSSPTGLLQIGLFG